MWRIILSGTIAGQLNIEQAVGQAGFAHLHAVSQYETARKLPGGNAAVQVFHTVVFRLPAMDLQLVVFDRDLDVRGLEPATAT